MPALPHLALISRLLFPRFAKEVVDSSAITLNAPAYASVTNARKLVSVPFWGETKFTYGDCTDLQCTLRQVLTNACVCMTQSPIKTHMIVSENVLRVALLQNI